MTANPAQEHHVPSRACGREGVPWNRSSRTRGRIEVVDDRRKDRHRCRLLLASREGRHRLHPVRRVIHRGGKAGVFREKLHDRRRERRSFQMGGNVGVSTKRPAFDVQDRRSDSVIAVSCQS